MGWRERWSDWLIAAYGCMATRQDFQANPIRTKNLALMTLLRSSTASSQPWSQSDCSPCLSNGTSRHESSKCKVCALPNFPSPAFLEPFWRMAELKWLINWAEYPLEKVGELWSFWGSFPKVAASSLGFQPPGEVFFQFNFVKTTSRISQLEYHTYSF